MSLLGIDVGTTGCKVVAFNYRGEILAKAYREYFLKSSEQGCLEINPLVVWEQLANCIKEVNSKIHQDPARALAVSTLGEAVVPISKSGEILANSQVSLDARSSFERNWWSGPLNAERLYAITGQPLHPMYTINKIIWLRLNRPNVYEKVDKFVCFGDFILWKLGLEPVIDYTMAARTMAFDIHLLQWSEPILELARLDKSQFSRVAPSGTIVGSIPTSIASNLGFTQEVIAVTGGHDQPCGALGCGVMGTGKAMYAIGTNECIAPILDSLNMQLGTYGFPCYPHVIPNKYITFGANFTGGSLLRWYRDTLYSEESSFIMQTSQDIYDRIINQVTDEESGIFVLPHFAGTGTPYLDISAKGAIIGLSFHTSRANIIKAILEGVTFEMAINLKLFTSAGIIINELYAIGGGAKSQIWLQMKADILGVKILSLDVTEAPSLGAAILAGLATGVFGSVNEANENMIHIQDTYYPDTELHKYYQDRFAIYEQLYPLFKPINALI